MLLLLLLLYFLFFILIIINIIIIGAWKKHERDQIEKATKFKMMTEVGTSNAIERVRYKAHDLRSDDEKRFVGIDLILHPEMYVSLKLAEIEGNYHD